MTDKQRKIVFANEDTQQVKVFDVYDQDGTKRDVPPLSDEYPFGCVLNADSNEAAAFFAALNHYVPWSDIFNMLKTAYYESALDYIDPDDMQRVGELLQRFHGENPFQSTED